ncbi:MAG: GNAT family N-acetyltransferase, partial [Jiangellaceae bacterium]
MLGTTAAAVAPLGRSDLPDVIELLGGDPVSHVFVASRVHMSELSAGRMGGELWGYRESGRLVSACYSGANLVPVAATSAAAHAFADRAGRKGRRCSSILGPADAVLTMWEHLRLAWGEARDVRPHQPVLALGDRPAVAPDPLVRRVRPDEVERLLPASIAMFTEEVGVSPVGSDGGAYYRARVTDLVTAGRAFARFEDGQVVFKAEIGAVTPDACQVQGVWIRPERRGQGLCAGGMAAVVEHARRDLAPVVTLYVNDYNTAARSAYRRVGF